jgi:hypothetical protein
MTNINISTVIRDDQSYVKEKLSTFPYEIQKILFREYCSIKERRDANLFLLNFEEQIGQKLNIKPSLLNLNHDEDSLREYAEQRTHLCTVYSASSNNVNINEICSNLINYANTYGISVNVNGNPKGIVKRLCDPLWWLRKFRKSLTRNVETVQHHLNSVNRIKGIYASDWPASQRRNQLRRHERSMSSTMFTNNLGQSFSLKELSDKSVSNPKIRKAELMARIRGFEDISKTLNHEALFLTITCPSKYHRSFSRSGDSNPKWGGYTPLDAQNYLNNIWQRIRAKLDRTKIRFYGFRVAEPNHDGTPHWHLLLFVNVNEAKPLTDVCKEYALMEDPNEKGAQEHRFTVKRIDPNKGSATGYIAKYISKNIDGSDLEIGRYGENPVTAAERVNAWASCWGIRQFQQLGGPSVSVWREARRLKEHQTEQNRSLEQLRHSADTSNWQEFIKIMGGVFVKRKDQLARPLYDYTMDNKTGELSQSYYDEEPTKSIKGMLLGNSKIITRFLKWTKLAFRQKSQL